ncbi:MAG TPA: type II toxin-antitoxin system VapC family toxin [Candidatus Obscuribacterales bacterium]
MRYLLDTNVLCDLIRNPEGRIMQKIREVGEQNICTSIIVTAELRYGAAKQQSPRLAAQLDAVLGAMDVLPFAAPADAIYGRLRHQLEQAGKLIGANDLLIASHAMAAGLTVVSDNEREFSRIDELPCENWLR